MLVLNWLTPELIWFSCGVVLIFLEFVVPGVILVFFGAGAVLTSLLVWMGVLPGATGQLVVFGVSSLGLLFGLRRYASHFFKGESTKETDDEYAGRLATVTREIVPGSPGGKVFFQGTDWEADSEVGIPEGNTVQITGKKNITLVVKPV